MELSDWEPPLCAASAFLAAVATVPPCPAGHGADVTAQSVPPVLPARTTTPPSDPSAAVDAGECLLPSTVHLGVCAAVRRAGSSRRCWAALRIH